MWSISKFYLGWPPPAEFARLIGFDRNHQIILKSECPRPPSYERQLDAVPSVTCFFGRKGGAQPEIGEFPEAVESVALPRPQSKLIVLRSDLVDSFLALRPSDFLEENS